MDRSELSELILGDLDAVLEKTRAAYLERMPRLRKLSPDSVDETMQATRRAMQHFVHYFVAGTLDAASWQAVRDATIDRAGEVYSHGEILEIMNIARAMGTEALHNLADRHPELSPAELARATTALDRYIAEMAETEDRLRQLVTPESLDQVLAALEADGADLE